MVSIAPLLQIASLVGKVGKIWLSKKPNQYQTIWLDTDLKFCFPHKEENPSFVRRISAHHRHDFGFSNQELKSVNVRQLDKKKQSMLFNVYVKNYIITHSCSITRSN